MNWQHVCKFKRSSFIYAFIIQCGLICIFSSSLGLIHGPLLGRQDTKACCNVINLYLACPRTNHIFDNELETVGSDDFAANTDKVRLIITPILERNPNLV